MKDERNVRQRRAAGRRWQPVAILLAAVLMVLSVPLGLTPAYAVDLGECSLTVNPGNAMSAEDLEKAGVVIDLYRIADAVEVSGYDTYDWSVNAPFAEEIGTIDKKIDGDGWKKLAQQVADVVLGKAPEGETKWDPTAAAEKIDASLKSTGNPAGTEIKGLKAGLYLVIARGTVYIKDNKYAATADGETPETSGTVTIANSETITYKFSPELVSLPTKEAVNDVINTANPGPWIYNPTITLKPSQEERHGNLEIVKTLDDYADREKKVGNNPRIMKDPATFVFKMTVYEDESKAKVIKEDYLSAVFDEFGTKTLLVENLPVNSFVVVKEEYSGRNYSAKVEEGSATIIADETVQVPFENYYDDREGGGGSVTNKFTNSEEKGKWTWEQLTDSSTEGSVIQSDSQSDNNSGEE